MKHRSAAKNVARRKVPLPVLMRATATGTAGTFDSVAGVLREAGSFRDHSTSDLAELRRDHYWKSRA